MPEIAQPFRLLVSPRAEKRIAAAREWLEARSPGDEVLVVGASLAAAHELLLEAARGAGSAFGWRRATLVLLARELALPGLAADGLSAVRTLGTEAVVARVLQTLGETDRLGRYAPVADAPGFVRALSATFAELRGEGHEPSSIRDLDPDLALLFEAYGEELAAIGTADPALVLRRASEAAAQGAAHQPLLDLPTLFLDVPLRSALESRLLQAIAARSPDALVTVVQGDARTLRYLGAGAEGRTAGAEGLFAAADSTAPAQGPTPSDSALARLQRYLFEPASPPPIESDETLTILSAPGENRECVEMARIIARLAAAGTPFDRVAVLLRSPEEYRPHLEEAFGRAGIPVWFERGVVRPDPAGRALLALLRCRAEGYSAARFAEYLSLGEVPDATTDGRPPPAWDDPQLWAAADEEGERALYESGEADSANRSAASAAAGASSPASAGASSSASAGASSPASAGAPTSAAVAASPDDAFPVSAGSLRAPRRWERLLVEASVVGGRERWERRLDGLAEELRLRLGGLDDPEEPAAHAIRRDLADLEHLRRYALPLLSELSGLPESAAWGDWLAGLSALATRGLREPERVLALLAELAPLGPVGPIGLGEVIRVLAPRLLEIRLPPADRRYGKVLVAPIEGARGRAFDAVFVPGLAERLFPKKIAEDPVLLDAERKRLGTLSVEADSEADAAVKDRIGALPTNEDRVAEERLALRIAVGAASRKLVLSYPRVEMVMSRPRIPSFYALEAVRAAEGELPLFERLSARAEQVTETRVGWPAPRDQEEAIDAAEYDLAALDRLGRRGEEAVRASGHLLTANPHLTRALRARAYRWNVPKWTWADGFLKPSAAAREALAGHAITARPYSVTALQNFAECPYRFFLHAIMGLRPREEGEAIEELHPLEKGSLVHETQFELLTRLREEGLLPVQAGNLDAARERLDEVLDEVAARWRDRLVPAIERVWEDEIDGIRTDLREWLRRESEQEGYDPWRFELSFGLLRDPGRDPHSTTEPVLLDSGIILRGAIDLVERANETLRVTDHKTGGARVSKGAVVEGGKTLQPIFYGLVAEKLFPELSVAAGRLYYCTAKGGYETREVELSGEARASAEAVARIVGRALEEGRLPALPDASACDWCDYLPVCGPDEVRRTKRKPEEAPLVQLRGLR